ITEDNLLPFEDASFDIVSSKGVLTHVQDKTVLFKEIFRVLKHNGLFVIEDWLSPIQGQWGEKLTKMALSEGLLLFAETETSYMQQLESAGFDVLEMRSESDAYSQYNRDIATKLAASDLFKKTFGEEAQNESIAGYNLIADSIDSNELLIRHFKAVKK
ncbi:MAG: methyltransferase domain-containing protein, partial [Verrucomicrobia bacterium]|nr:methyltransferase domain-containing protein [Verrucomicrobiota bacterium]